MEKSFAALWQRDRLRFALPAAAWSVLATSFAAAPLAWGALGVIGWPLAAAGAAAILAAHGWNALVAPESGPLLDYYAPRMAPQPLQDIAAGLFHKAGLPYAPEIRVLSKNVPRLYGLRRSVGIIPLAPQPGGKATILLGSQVAGLLNPEEMTAVLAHATARFMVRPPVAGLNHKIGNDLQTALLTGGLLTFNVPFLALSVGAILLRRLVTNLVRNQDDILADRNAVALFPHPTALSTASAKVQNIVLDARRFEFSRIRQLCRRIEGSLFHNRVAVAHRKAVLAESLEEARDFHATHGLPTDGRDVLPPALRAAWTNERIPHFWEKVLPPPPLPASPGAGRLGEAWDKKDGGGQTSCKTDCPCPSINPKAPQPPG